MIVHSQFMQMALEEAKKAFMRDEVPVGAVIVDEHREIISSASNRMEELNDPTAHAEILAIRSACADRENFRLTGCSIYITLEPCQMCAQAISFARISRLYYGARDAKYGGIENGSNIFSSSSCHHKPDIYSGISEEESIKLMRNFFLDKRG